MVLLASLVACVIALVIQHTVPFSLTPYLLMWGLLLIPTFLAWTAFVMAAYAAVGNRYGAYALCLGSHDLHRVPRAHGRDHLGRQLAAVGCGALERPRLLRDRPRGAHLNRVMVLGFAVLFTVIAVRLFARRGADAVRTMHRLAPGRVLARRYAVSVRGRPAHRGRGAPVLVSHGIGGGAAKKADKDYWAKNLKTWFEAPLPDIARFDVAVKVDPARHWLSSDGTFTLVNRSTRRSRRFRSPAGCTGSISRGPLNGPNTSPTTASTSTCSRRRIRSRRATAW